MASILWIEDETNKIGGLVRPLQQDGHDIFIAEDEEDALNKIKTISKIDLIILDLIIPEGGKHWKKDIEEYVGLNLLRQLIDIEKINIPIIVLSVVDDEEALEKVREMGITKILRKGSYLPSTLRKEVYEVLGIIK